ncbi:MAG: hypothetical protein WA581_15580 [Candidatus Acidiferrales bacterium]
MNSSKSIWSSRKRQLKAKAKSAETTTPEPGAVVKPSVFGVVRLNPLLYR